MAAFNILNASIICKDCRHTFAIRIQFKFGSARHYEYKLYDHIKWSDNINGEPMLSKVKAYGIAESTECRNCGEINNEEYDIIIEQNIILKAEIMTDYEYMDCNEGNYKIYD